MEYYNKGLVLTFIYESDHEMCGQFVCPPDEKQADSRGANYCTFSRVLVLSSVGAHCPRWSNDHGDHVMISYKYYWI